MTKQLYILLGAGLMAVAMWVWVQDIAIPHQQSDAVARGIPRGNLSDLYPRWLGARELLLHRRDPYSADLTREIQTGYYGRPLDPTRPDDPKDQQAFAYPVYVVFVLAPTVEMPFPVVQRIFLALLVMVTAASVLWWMQALGWSISVTARLTWIVLALGCFPVIQGIKLQQLTLLVAALLAASMMAISRRNLVWAGILLAFATIKPQLALLVVLWLCIWVVGNWRERQRLFWSFAVSMAVLLAASEWVLPGWIGKFRAASAAYYQYTGGGKSVLDVLLSPTWGRIVSVIVVSLCMVLVWGLRHAAAGTADFRWSLGLVLATTLVIIPMFAPYNQLLLIPALMEIVRAMRLLWRQSRVSRFFLAVTGLVVAWPWIAAASLAVALIFLPARLVREAWALPLYTSLAIPVMVLALMLAGTNAVRLER
ncbi:MAG TPA: glycosyltransferase family 87 protein [Candidatus Dormibacteraeota bacterium]|nr:glycosyltransferase family 87 protein [Candidatus Dormibacteraeota bacterium]